MNLFARFTRFAALGLLALGLCSYTGCSKVGGIDLDKIVDPVNQRYYFVFENDNSSDPIMFWIVDENGQVITFENEDGSEKLGRGTLDKFDGLGGYMFDALVPAGHKITVISTLLDGETALKKTSVIPDGEHFDAETKKGRKCSVYVNRGGQFVR